MAAYRAASTAAASSSAYTLPGDAAVEAFRRFGHLHARIDPLGLAVPPARPELDAATADLAARDPALLERLRATYCGPLGAEFDHCDTAAERVWWAEQLESRMPTFTATPRRSANAAVAMLQADTFEQFLARKYVSLKRYSGEGTEALLPALDAVFAAAAGAGVRDAVIGMAHRGRLAVLVSLLGYPARKLFHKIHGYDAFPGEVQGVDDVTSHIAAAADKVYGGKSAIHVSLLHNPSHLEAVNPVAAGKTRAKRDLGSSAALCIQIHGDAAVYGQGVVAETYAMSALPGYDVGGTIHVITNNQVGFTADCGVSRSSRYASDGAKAVNAPVLHVNAESIREVLLAAQLAVEYRQRFGRDVVLDLIGYRRHGHNELDDPSFTQPAMYRSIRPRKAFAVEHAAALEAAGVFNAGHVASLVAKLNAHLEAEFAASKSYSPAGGCTDTADPKTPGKHVVGDGSAFAGRWCAMRLATADELRRSPDTGIPAEALRGLGRASVTLPAGFKVHDRLQRGHVTARLKELDEGNAASAKVDWAGAEALAFGSLLAAGFDVRMSGQDVQRGTFSHRHAVLVDQTTGAQHAPLNHLPASLVTVPGGQQGKLRLYSSLLSEEAVLGFEYGYSWETPQALVVWEAQFGDFANGAQIMIDQFISGGESKWLRQSGLTLLLPHGYDGAGPEHSSCRIERFLQLVNSQGWARGADAVSAKVAATSGHRDKTLTEATNLLIVNPTTPANYFHALRRQMIRPFRKPLVVVAPKTLLRLEAATSPLAAMAPGTHFQSWLPDPAVAAGVVASADVDRVLVVSGKVFYDLAARRAGGAPGMKRTAIVRVEELAPFPTEEIVTHIASTFPGIKSLVWMQEEPANAGAWTWAEAHLAPALAAAKLPSLQYVGRPALAAPAVGLSKLNKAQEDYIMRLLGAVSA